MQRKHNFTSGEFYHIYNRGNNRQKIFLDDQDRNRFVKALYLSNSVKDVNFRDDIVNQKIDAWDFDRGEQLVSIGAWVLMPNHFHLYITPSFTFRKSDLRKSEENMSDRAVSKFMQKLLTSYSKYFNKKYARTGGIFEGKFQSVHVESDEQAKYLFSYIHLNPIRLIDSPWKENGIQDKNKSIQFLHHYDWSSYQDYQEIKRSESIIISPDRFPEYFAEISDFDAEIMSWLSFEEDSILLS
jgi:REP element-mobilizing transposase RayT